MKKSKTYKNINDISKNIIIGNYIQTKKRDILIELIKENLDNKNFKYKITNIDLNELNKTHHLNFLLNSNLSIEEIKKIKNVNTIFKKTSIYKRDKLRKIKRILREKNTIYIYSQGIDNVLHKLNCSKREIIFNSKKRKNAIARTNFSVLRTVKNEIEENINKLIVTNNNLDIILVNLYIPKVIENLSYFFEDFKDIKNIYEKFNENLYELKEKYNTGFIDNNALISYCKYKEINEKGLEILAENIAKNIMKRNCLDCNIRQQQKVNNKKYEGLDGMIKQTERIIKIRDNSLNFTTKEKEKYFNEEIKVYKMAKK